MVEEALRGHDAPLRRALGITPEGALRKVPEPFCKERGVCVHWVQATCSVLSKKAPWCFVPESKGVDQELSDLLAEVIRQWRDSVYVTVVEEDDYA